MIDPITFEVVRNGLIGVANEMAVTIVRTAHSQVLRDSLDFSTAVCDRRGRVVAQGLGMALHLGAVPDAMEALLDKHEVRPGDVFVNNDPLQGGMHLPDIFMFKPVFHDGRLVGFAVCVAHYPDIGGRTPGGNAVDSTEIYQEGLQIPLLKLDDTLREMLAANVRLPAAVMGDLNAQLGSCRIGEARMLALDERYGADGLAAITDEILDYTERRAREGIRGLRDGTYSFVDHIDDDGMGSGPIPIAVRITIAGDELEADFAGTSGQVRSALNATPSWTKSAVYTALKCLFDQSFDANDGFYRPVRVVIPAGTILNPRHPAPRAARGLTGYRTIDAVFGALQQAAPDRVWAAGDGGVTMLAIGGRTDGGDPFVFVDFTSGSWGARPAQDGVDGAASIGANIANVPVEEIERAFPIQVRQYELLPDTGGAGRWRGGQSIARELVLLAGEGELHIRSDRRRFRPYGLEGGREGAPSANVLNDAELLPTCVTRRIGRGDVVRQVSAGGGGHGDPRDRDPSLVLRDVLDGRVSVEAARREYGVVIDR